MQFSRTKQDDKKPLPPTSHSPKTIVDNATVVTLPFQTDPRVTMT